MLDERIRRGMAAQLAERRRRLEAGARPLGWKVGFGAPAAMRTLGIGQPLIGYLLRSALLPSGSDIVCANFTRLAVEPEIAVHLGTDLGTGEDRAGTAAAIAGLGPAIEVADVAFPPDSGPEAILAGNVYQTGVVLGQCDPSRAGARLAGLAAAVSVDGVAVEVPADLEANTGPILDVVATVADTLAAMGECLCTGEIILVGSLVAPLFPGAGTTFDYTLGEAPSLSIRVS